MASKRIKGITIEIGADTKKLTDELQKAEKQINDAAYKLRDVNKLLKLDPKNTELLTQKQKYLLEAINGTKEKLKEERKALEQLQAGPQTKDAIDQQEALGREIAETTQKLDRLKDEYKEFGTVATQQTKAAGESMKATGQEIMDIGSGIRNVGQSMTTHVTAPIVAGFAASAKAAIDWETAFTGVMKTVDASPEEYKQLEDAIMKMSTEMASSKTEIAGVMEVAGQLGVTGVDNLIAFTKTAIMLGDTTNLSAEDAATSLARVLNMTGDGYDKIDRLGSVVVDLGNHFTTSESEITNMATRLTSAGKISGFTTQEIFALAAAMSSVGIEAEAGGTAMATTFKNIQAAVSDFSKEGATEKEKENLRLFAKIAGQSAEEFAQAWKTKPMDALQSFITGLSNLRDEGGDTFAMLDELGMSGIRQSNMLQALSTASGMMGDAVATANKAWEENTALSDEAAKRYNTMAVKLIQLRERLTNLAKIVGDRLMPYLDKLIVFLDKVTEKLKGMSEEDLDAAIKIAAFAAAIGPVLMVIGNLIFFVGKVTWALGSLNTAFAGLTGASAASAELAAAEGAASGLGASLLSLLGPIALVATAFAVWIHNWDEIKEAGRLLVERTQEHLTEIRDAWHEVTDALAVYVPAKWNEIKNKASAALTGIKIGCQMVWDQISGIFTSKVEFIKGVIDGGFGFVYDTIKSRLQAAYDFLSSILDDIKGAFEFLVNLARTWGENLINNFLGGINTKIDFAKAMVKGIGDKIQDTVPNTAPMQTPAGFTAWSNAAARDYSGQLASINNGIGQLATAGGGDIIIPVNIGQQKLDNIVVRANQRNNFRSGGR